MAQARNVQIVGSTCSVVPVIVEAQVIQAAPFAAAPVAAAPVVVMAVAADVQQPHGQFPIPGQLSPPVVAAPVFVSAHGVQAAPIPAATGPTTVMVTM